MGAPMITPMLIGAGVGALGGAVTGRNPLQTALLGGALGSGYGALSGGAGLGGATAGISGATAPAVSVANLMPTTLAVAPESVAASSPLFGYTASGLSPYASAAEIAATPSAASIGAGLGSDTIANMAITDPSLLDKLKPYANVQNLSGAMNIAEKFQPKKPTFISAPSGGVTRGQAPQSGGLILSMDELMKLSQLQRSNPISLLVG